MYMVTFKCDGLGRTETSGPIETLKEALDMYAKEVAETAIANLHPAVANLHEEGAEAHAREAYLDCMKSMKVVKIIA